MEKHDFSHTLRHPGCLVPNQQNVVDMESTLSRLMAEQPLSAVREAYTGYQAHPTRATATRVRTVDADGLKSCQVRGNAWPRLSARYVCRYADTSYSINAMS